MWGFGVCICGACLCWHSRLGLMCIGQKMSDVLPAMHTLICSLETESLTDLGLVTQFCNLSTCEPDLGISLATSKPRGSFCLQLSQCWGCRSMQTYTWFCMGMLRIQLSKLLIAWVTEFGSPEHNKNHDSWRVGNRDRHLLGLSVPANKWVNFNFWDPD